MGLESLNIEFDPSQEHEFIITPVHELFYSEDTDFGVYKFSTDNNEPFTQNTLDFEGNLKYTGNLAGVTGKLEQGVNYKMLAVVELNKKYNKMQYNPLEISVVKPTTVDESKIYLKACGLNERQVDGLLEVHPDVLDKIINDEKIDVTAIKGIREKTMENLTKKVKKTFTSLELVTFLSPFGISLNAVMKIFGEGTNPSVVKKQIKANPYILTKIKGFGFKKADDIALKINESFRKSRFRTEAFIIYYLTDQANTEGHTWVSSDIFLAACRDNIPECKEFIFEILREEDNKWLYADKQTKRVGLKYYRNLEYKIASEIVRLRDKNSITKLLKYDELNKKILKVEEDQGFEFTDEQRDAIYQVYQGNIVAITGGAGCVDGETEYFNGVKWVKIKDYKQGDDVLQFDNITREATLVEPIRYVKEKEETLYQLKNYTGTVDQVLSLDHNFAYITSKNHIRTKLFSEVVENHKSLYGCGYSILNAFDYNGTGIDMSDDWIRLMIAVFADGSYYYHMHEHNDSYLTCRFHIKKERKKERLRELIGKVGIPCREKESAAEGYSDIYIQTPFRAKTFPESWYKANKHQLEVIFDEVLHWDGTFGQKGRRSFSTTIKSDADFIQFVASSLGYTANIGTYDRTGQARGKYIRKSVEYAVIISINKWRYTSMKTRDEKLKQEIIPYTEHDGYKYCFTVPTGYLVLRRNNKIFISGNCGKTSVVNGILKSSDADKEKIAQVALAGKAALRIQEINGYPASTIHRLLGFEMGEFIHNKHNPIDKDYIVIDEASMVGAELFYDLLQSIPTGSRIVIMGDTGQLDSIGVGSVFKDLLQSEVIPVVRLTKIHRQAQKSAIITESIKVSNGKNIVPNGFVGSKVLGELEDLVLDISDDKDDTMDLILKRLKEELEIEDINEIQVIVPMKERGMACTYKLNNKIQEIVNPSSPLKNEITLRANTNTHYIIRKGDKVINVTNQYQTTDLKGEVCPVFNGNLGTVIDIYSKEMIIDFVGVGIVSIPKDKWKSIELGYAITTHKSQGSQWNKVIVGIDSSSYIMLSKEQLYTAMTRAVKKCYICGENSAIKKACSTSKLLHKNTFLKDILINEREDKHGK